MVGTIISVYAVSNILHLYLSVESVGQHRFDLSLTQLIEDHPLEYRWALKFIVNCMGYSCIVIPGILIYHYTRKIKYLERCCKY